MTDKTDAVHEGLPVLGYKPQTETAVKIVNEHKRWEEQLLQAIDALWEGDVYECDRRWLSIAKTHFEEGFMALNRAVFQPKRITLPEDEDATQS